jgi:serine/threonine-protein kinase
MTTSGQAGALIAGRYRLERPTGGGTWPEELWQGFDETLGRSVMLRLLPVDEQVEEGVEEQAHSVVAQVARLGHPNIAQVYDVGQEAGLRYVVSEWTGGRTLGQIMATGRQRWQRAVDWGQQIAEALAALHSVGLVDGVLGPETVSVLDDRRVKLTDVGLGVAQDAGARPSGFVGPDDEATRLLPPDQRQGRSAWAEGGEPERPAGPDDEATRLLPPGAGAEPGEGGEPTRISGPYATGSRVPAGAAADVYALGAILWTAMVGVPPQVEPTDLQGPDTAPLHAIGAPDELARLLRSMLAASEQVRPMAAIAANRFAALAIEGRERSDTLPAAVVAPPTQVLGPQVGARPSPAAAAGQRQSEDAGGRGPALALAIGLVLLLAAGATALALWLTHGRNNPAPVIPPATGASTSADVVSISAAPTTSSAAPATSAAPSSSPSPSPSATPSPSASPSASPSPSQPPASSPPATPSTGASVNTAGGGGTPTTSVSATP